MFSVCTAAAIGGSKLNLLLQFDRPPAAAQVMSRAIAAFSQLQEERGDFTPFFCNCVMIFDDAASRWVPLERSSQVVHNCQVYLFQPDVPDVAGPIPDPVPACAFLIGYRSPDRSVAHSASPRGLMPRDPDLSRFDRPAYYAPPHDYGASAAAFAAYAATSPPPLPSSPPSSTFKAPFVAGGSILREERDREDAKITLPVDTHRERIREETRRFGEDVSPARRSMTTGTRNA